MAGYTRQSTFADGDTITAALFNNEYNQLLNAFSNTGGHKHDGTAAEGPVIGLIGDAGVTTPLNKVLIDSTNDHIEFWIEVSSSAVQQLYIADGAIVPVTDNDIDLGTSSLQFKDLYINGTANIDSLVLATGSTVTAVLDEDDLSSDSATSLVTQQSVKAYIDAQVTAQDLDFLGDSGGALSIDLDSESLTIAGGTGLDTVGSSNTITINIDATVATLTGTQTLTNKTIDVDNNTVSNIEVDNFKASAIVLESEGIGSNDNDTSLPTSAAVKDYVDTQITAEDLDITTDSGTIAIDLDSETLTVSGGTGLDSSATGNAVTLAIDSTVTTLTGTQTLTNKTLTSPDINTPDIDGGTIDGATIATSDVTVGSGKTLNVSAGTLTLADNQISGDKVEGGTIAATTITDLTFGSLNDGTITATAFVDEDNMVSNSATLIPTQQSVKAYVDTTVAATNEVVEDTTPQLGGDLDLNSNDITGTGNINITGTIQSSGNITGTLATAAQPNITSVGTLTGLTTTGDINFGDNDKAIFGAGSDLQIYHDSATGQSIISETGAGSFIIKGTNLFLQSADGEYMFRGNANGASSLYYDGSAKLATTSTGIDVTGTVVADGLTVDATGVTTASFTQSANTDINGLNGIRINNSSGTTYAGFGNSGADSVVITAGDAGGTGNTSLTLKTADSGSEKSRLNIANNGDISFYEDTGTSAALFWDASAESLGIGTTSPDGALDIEKTVNTAWSSSLRANDFLQISNPSTTSGAYSGIELIATGTGSAGAVEIVCIDSGSGSGDLAFSTRNGGTWGEKVRVTAAGNVGIGTDSPDTKMHISDTTGNAIIRLERNDTTISTNDIYGEIQFEGQDASAASAAGVRGKILGVAEGATGEMALTFETAGGYGSSTERMRIDSSGNLLVGKTSASSASIGFQAGQDGFTAITRASAQPLVLNRTTNDGIIVEFKKDATQVGSIGTMNFGDMYLGTDDTGVYFNNGIDSISPVNTTNQTVRDNAIDLGASNARFKDLHLSGTGYFDTSVGIGTDTPDTLLHLSGADTAIIRLENSDSSLTTNQIIGGLEFEKTDGSGAGAGVVGGLRMYSEGGVGESTYLTLSTSSSSANNVEAVRIDNSQRLLVGTTNIIPGVSNTETGVSLSASLGVLVSRAGEAPLNLSRNTNDGDIAIFRKSGSAVGSVSVTGSATAYNTSSDARLKDVTGEARGLEVINELNPVSYNWKADGKADEGLIAQEVQEIVPNAVSGSEEEMYQMDYSKLVVHLVKGMKEQQTQIEALQSEINLLKGE